MTDGIPGSSALDTAPSNSEPTSLKSRLPIVVAVAIYLALLIIQRLLVPDRPTLGTRWLHPGMMALLLGTVVWIATSPVSFSVQQDKPGAGGADDGRSSA